MPIDLTAQEPQPTITQARLRKIIIDALARSIVTEVAFGYVNGQGKFVDVKQRQFRYTDETSPSFAQAIQAAPALLTARDQIEAYYASGIIPGTVV